MKKFIFFSIVSILIITGCKVKPVACLYSNPTAGVGNIVDVRSCGHDIDAFQWKVEGGGETIIQGGDFCDNFISLQFSSAGEKTIRLIAWKFKKKNAATCESGLNAGKTDEAIYTVTVK